ncbi:hypothetical protein [Priestia megaterium]|uniref:hypothetical protein n=1 Tax=Priestia megaterium TaxID=1404 RepID=UPI003F81539D
MNETQKELVQQILKGIEDIKAGNEKLNAQYDMIGKKLNQNLKQMDNNLKFSKQIFEKPNCHTKSMGGEIF